MTQPQLIRDYRSAQILQETVNYANTNGYGGQSEWNSVYRGNVTAALFRTTETITAAAGKADGDAVGSGQAQRVLVDRDGNFKDTTGDTETIYNKEESEVSSGELVVCVRTAKGPWVIVGGGVATKGRWYKTPSGGIPASVESGGLFTSRGSATCDRLNDDGTALFSPAESETLYNPGLNACRGDWPVFAMQRDTDSEWEVIIEPCPPDTSGPDGP